MASGDYMNGMFDDPWRTGDPNNTTQGSIWGQPKPDIPMPVSNEPPNYQKTVQDILGKYNYGAAGLGQAAGELQKQGIELQQDSSGRYRGRIKLPTGELVDVTDQREGNNWWDNQTGTQWGWNNRGANTDSGGWSFGGGAPASQASSLMQQYFGQEGPLAQARPATPTGVTVGGGGAPTMVQGAPAFDSSWLGSAEDWNPANPAEAWQRILAVHRGQMTPEQLAFAEKQAQSGGTAYNPFTKTGGAPTAAAAGAPAAQDPKSTLIQQLMDRMQQGLKVDTNDPVIRTQADSFAASQDRARRNYQSEAAERIAAKGLGDTGELQNERRLADEQSANAQGQFEAELVGREIMARRQEIQSALDSMGSLLTEQERQALQRELAAADNALKRYGIDVQNKQFYSGLSQADRHFAEELALRQQMFGSDDAFRYAQLGQQGDQWRDQMGFNVADRQAYWDSQRRGG